MLRASANHIRLQSIHGNLIDNPTTSNTNSPNARHPFFKHNTRHHPISYALRIDRVSILLDAGCPHTMADSSQWLSAYAKVIHSIDGVLLSGPEIITCGAVPFLKKLRPDIEIVAMLSTSKIGLYTMLSTFQNLFGFEKTFPYFDPITRQQTSMTLTSEDVYRAFQSITEPFGFKATFSPVALGARMGGADSADEQTVVARPSPNGQCLGGFIWVLSYQTDEITYAPSFSAKTSSYLKTPTRATMDAPSRCNLLLTDASAASVPALPSLQAFAPEGSHGRVTDFDALATVVKQGLADDQDIIIPIDAAIKGVEVLCSLVKHFDMTSMRTPIVFVFPHGNELLKTVKTDPMNEAALNSEAEFLARVHCVKSVAEAAEYRSPRVLVCDGADLDFGLGIEMLEELQRLSKKWTLCFTHFPAPWTNAGRIYAKFHPELSQHQADDTALAYMNRNTSSGVVTRYVCDSVKKGSGSAFNQGRGFAANLSSALSDGNSISLSYTKRREMDREERANFLELKRRESEAAESARVQQEQAAAGDHIVQRAVDSSDDDEDVTEDAAAFADEGISHTPGLFLPSHLGSFNTKHLVFPCVSSGAGELTPYGMALQEWELQIFSKRGHIHTDTDTGPSHQGPLRIELLEYASMPAHISREVDKVFGLDGCRCATIDMSNILDVRGMLSFLKGFPGAKKVVFLKGSTVDTQKHIVTPLQADQKSRAALVSSNALSSSLRMGSRRTPLMATSIQYFLQTSYIGKGAELASVVAAFDVRLAPDLASLAQRSLCKVQEREVVGAADQDNSAATAQRSFWEIGWLHGYVAPPRKIAFPNEVSSAEGEGPEKKRRIEFDGAEGSQRAAAALTAEEMEQADIAAFLDDEDCALPSEGDGPTLAPQSAPANSLEMSDAQRKTEKAAAIKTLYPIPAALEAQALSHMEQEGIVQGSVFVGSLSLSAIGDQARDMHKSILAAVSSRSGAGTAGGRGIDGVASSMGGDMGTDMRTHQSLIASINLSTPDGTDVLSAELLGDTHEALVLGRDTIVRQQGAASGGRRDDSSAILGDVAVEGVISPNFFAVRELLYSQFARIL